MARETPVEVFRPISHIQNQRYFLALRLGRTRRDRVKNSTILQHSFKMPITTTKLSKSKTSRRHTAHAAHHRLVTLPPVLTDAMDRGSLRRRVKKIAGETGLNPWHEAEGPSLNHEPSREPNFQKESSAGQSNQISGHASRRQAAGKRFGKAPRI